MKYTGKVRKYGLLLVALSYSGAVFSMNECRAIYADSSGEHRVNIDKGSTTTLQGINNIKWIKNDKARPIDVRITNKRFTGFGWQNDGLKWVTLTNKENFDPPTAVAFVHYPPGVSLYRVRCHARLTGEIDVGVTVVPTEVLIRHLKPSEIGMAAIVYGSSINFGQVRVTNTLGGGARAWTTNTPPVYTINVGIDGYEGLDRFGSLLIHELAHVWQGQHGIEFMSNSVYHQALSVARTGNPGGAYDVTAGRQWRVYNSEQQASIIEAWFVAGMRTTDELFPYIRDNVRTGRPFANTNLPATASGRVSNRPRSTRPGPRRNIPGAMNRSLPKKATVVKNIPRTPPKSVGKIIKVTGANVQSVTVRRNKNSIIRLQGSNLHLLKTARVMLNSRPYPGVTAAVIKRGRTVQVKIVGSRFVRPTSALRLEVSDGRHNYPVPVSIRVR